MNYDKQILPAKLSIDDYNAFLILTKLEYQAGLIKEESTSELLRFTIRHIQNHVRNEPGYLILKHLYSNNSSNITSSKQSSRALR
jgi:hypothetical protein